jgi:YHS domain-containing protein
MFKFHTIVRLAAVPHLLCVPAMAIAGHSPDPAMASGCQKSCSYKGKVHQSTIVKQAKAKVGDLVLCPVSGVAVKVKPDTVTVTHNGKKYFVCCASCAERFRLNPEQFV